MRALKDKGIEDLDAVRARAKKLHALGRIDEESMRRLIDVLHEAEAVIVNMTERDTYGEELGEG